jgi:hypothetical protein
MIGIKAHFSQQKDSCKNHEKDKVPSKQHVFLNVNAQPNIDKATNTT